MTEDEMVGWHHRLDGALQGETRRIQGNYPTKSPSCECFFLRRVLSSFHLPENPQGKVVGDALMTLKQKLLNLLRTGARSIWKEVIPDQERTELIQDCFPTFGYFADHQHCVWRRKWQPTPVFLPGESQGWGSLVGCHLQDHTESDTTEVTQQQQHYVRKQNRKRNNSYYSMISTQQLWQRDVETSS